jgi:hypothetical protein
VLCGLPIKKPAAGHLLHERRNGQFSLQVTGHRSYGLPWGQDRLIPIFLATLAIRQQSQTIQFRSAAEMLDSFGMQQGGTQYRRLVAAFQRIFGATINQLGSSDYARPRKFRERLEGWLELVRSMWPECTAVVDTTGTGLWVDRAAAVLPAGGK